jgi:hypothetical protein
VTNKFLNPNRLIYLFVIFNIVLGGFIVKDFGKSWDEDRYFEYGNTSAQFYSDIKYGFTAHEGSFGIANHQYYGPFYIMVANVFVDKLENLFADWDPSNYYHFFYFITFQVGVILLYYLCTRFMSDWASFVSALLFGTQPLLVGHAFINPKDIPFMVFFMLSIYLGIYMVEGFGAKGSEILNKLESLERPHFEVILLQDVFNDAKPYFTFRKRGVKVFWILWVFITTSYILSRFFLDAIVRKIISIAYNSDSSSVLGYIFSKLAEDADRLPLKWYLNRGSEILSDISSVLLVLSIFFFPLIISPLSQKLRRFKDIEYRLLIRRGLLNFVKTFFEGFKSFYSGINKGFLKEILKHFTNRAVLLAGIIFGITSSLRIIGPAAGVIITVYFFLKLKQKSIHPLISYSVIGSISAYLTWPFLWKSPVSRYLSAVRLMANYPWENDLLFKGEIFKADALPATYLPSLISIQLTESILLLALLGICLVLYQIRKKYHHRYLIILLWLFLPLIYTILFTPTMYDNFRQFLFLIPPLFVFGGIAIDSIKVSFFENSKALYILLIITLAYPGIYNAVKLHPYQYIYYNSFVGGVGNAFRRYELDYWAASLKENMDFVNRHAEKDAKIIVWGGPIWVAQGYAREDLTITSMKDIPSEAWSTYDYQIVLTRRNLDIRFKEMVLGPVIYQTARCNGILSKVVQVEK